MLRKLEEHGRLNQGQKRYDHYCTASRRAVAQIPIVFIPHSMVKVKRNAANAVGGGSS